jgi:hypothetical protein
MYLSPIQKKDSPLIESGLSLNYSLIPLTTWRAGTLDLPLNRP